MNSRPAIFLDRDGTIIEDQHYPRDPGKVMFCPNASEGMRLMMDKGYLLFVVSNQSGVGRGIIKDFEFNSVHQRCAEILQKAKIEIAEFLYCLHKPEDECACRKPKTALVPKTFKGVTLDWTLSFIVGDRESDLQLADNMGAQAALVLTGKGKATAEAFAQSGETSRYLICDDLLDFAESLSPTN